MKSGPRMKTMEKALGVVAPLTDWYPASVLPVREGFYEVRNNRVLGSRSKAKLVGRKTRYWTGSMWLTQVDGQSSIFGKHDSHEWRGVRRWVLVQCNEPILGCDAYIKHRTPQNTKWTVDLAQAKGFDTEAKALAYRDHGRWPFGLAKIEAVLP